MNILSALFRLIEGHNMTNAQLAAQYYSERGVKAYTVTQTNDAGKFSEHVFIEIGGMQIQVADNEVELIAYLMS